MQWALANGMSETDIYKNINDFLATNPTAAQTQAQMAQFGISPEDVAAATGGTSGGVLSGNIMSGASWNSLNTTLGDELTAATGQATSNYAVGGATTADTLAQLNTFLAGGGQFDPNATVYLASGGVDFITGVDRSVVKDNLNQIVKTLGDQGVNVVLTGSPYAKSVDDVINNNFDPKVDSIFTEIAKENKNVALVGTQGEILQNKKLLVDALHTNAEGTAVYNQSVIDALSQFKNEVPPSTPQAIAQVEKTNTVATAPPAITQAATQASGIASLPAAKTQTEANKQTQLKAVSGGKNTVFEDVEMTQDELASLITNTALQTKLGGKVYDLDRATVDKITQQILGQGTTAKWKGEGFGSAEKNAMEMAKQLAASGVTDINQVGQKTVTMPGQSSFDEQGNETIGQDYTVTQIVNKATGLPLINDYGERGTGNAWSGTYTGDGNTAFRVNFDAKGNPIFYTTAASSNDLVNILGDNPILNAIAQIGAAYFGGPAGTAALQAAMGKDIGDIAKSALLSYAGGEVAKGLSTGDAAANVFGQTGSDITKSLVDTFGETGANIVAKTAGQTVTSEGKIDPLSLLLTNGVNAATNALLNNVEGFKNLDTQQKKLVTGLANGFLNDGKLSPQEAINAAFSAATTAVKNPDQIEAQVKAAKSAQDNAISTELDKQLTIDASGAKDINAAAAFADAAGFNKFTFDNKTYTLDTSNAAKSIAEIEAEIKADAAAAQAATTAANLKGGDFEGVDSQVAATAKANNTVIGNTEADTLEEAAALARLRNPTGTSFTYGKQITSDGNLGGDLTYTMGASQAAVDQVIAEAKAANLQTEIANAPTRDAAYKIAREGLGAGKTFTYNGKEYSTATAEERPDLTGKTTQTTATTPEDQSAAETARLLAQNKTLADAAVVNQSPAEVARLLAKNADLVAGNVTANQSASETARLAAQNNTLVLGNAPNESTAETQRLVEAGERSVLQNLDSMALQALGMTARGAASFISNAGETYAQLTGDFNYDNAATKLGKEIAEYAKSKDAYGLDVQKNRLTQSLAQADNTDNFLDKMSIIGSAIKKNPLGFFDVAGSEFVEEAPETAIQIVAALMSGGASLSLTGARAIQGAASLIGSFAETFGSAGKEAYQKSIARGDSVQVAKDKSYINASINALAEMVPDYFADKALVAPIMKKFTEKTLKGIGVGYATNAAAGIVSEFTSGTIQNYSTQYVVDPTKASWSKAITNGIFESAIGGTVQTAMATPNTVIDTGAVIGRDYSGNNVTLQQVLDGGSNIDASTVDSSTAIAKNADGTNMTVGSAILFAQENNAGVDVIGSFLPSNLTSADVVVATETTITAESAQQVMADLGLNVSDDVAISLATKLASSNAVNEVTLGSLITDMTGKPASLTGKSDTSTVISLDTGAGTAVVMDAKGNTDVVSVSGDVKVGSVVTVDAATSEATATGSTVASAANTATVVSVDAASGTAIVADSNGSSSVVNVSGDVQVGSTVTVNAATGTATATDAATAKAADAATSTAVTAAASTAADTAVNSAATAATAADTAASAATTAAAATNAANTAATTNNAATSLDVATSAATSLDVATSAATTAATATDAATAAASNAAAATDVATAASNAAAAATDVATSAAAATGTSAAANAATTAASASDVATSAAAAATNAAAATTAATSTAATNAAATNAAATNAATTPNAAAATTPNAAAAATTPTAATADVAPNAAATTDVAPTAAVATSPAVSTSVIVSVDKLDDTVLVQNSDGTFDVIANPGDATVGDVISVPAVVETPVETPVITTPVVTTPVITTPVVTAPVETPVVTTPVTTPTTKTPTPKTTSTPTTPTQAGSVGGGASDATPPPLANVFYYGKDFSSQRQQIGPGGRLVQTPFRELSVERPGAETPVAQQGRTEENDAEAMLQKILSQKEDTVTMDELMRLLG